MYVIMKGAKIIGFFIYRKVYKVALNFLTSQSLRTYKMSKRIFAIPTGHDVLIEYDVRFATCS